MRYTIFILLAMLIYNGCKFVKNPLEPDSNQTLSVSAVMDSIQYTFAVPKSTFGINDTLTATITAYNQSSNTDTLTTGYNPSFYNWTLTNDSTGKTIMYGPAGADDVVMLVPIAVGKSRIIYSISEAIADTSGAAVLPGKYVLRWNLNSATTTLLWFNLNLTIQ